MEKEISDTAKIKKLYFICTATFCTTVVCFDVIVSSMSWLLCCVTLLFKKKKVGVSEKCLQSIIYNALMMCDYVSCKWMWSIITWTLFGNGAIRNYALLVWRFDVIDGKCYIQYFTQWTLVFNKTSYQYFSNLLLNMVTYLYMKVMMPVQTFLCFFLDIVVIKCYGVIYNY